MTKSRRLRNVCSENDNGSACSASGSLSMESLEIGPKSFRICTLAESVVAHRFCFKAHSERSQESPL